MSIQALYFEHHESQFSAIVNDFLRISFELRSAIPSKPNSAAPIIAIYISLTLFQDLKKNIYLLKRILDKTE